MRALILSDIHANLEALEAVLADARARGGFDAIWCLGDTVGYGPDPGACVDRIREFELVSCQVLRKTNYSFFLKLFF